MKKDKIAVFCENPAGFSVQMTVKSMSSMLGTSAELVHFFISGRRPVRESAVTGDLTYTGSLNPLLDFFRVRSGISGIKPGIMITSSGRNSIIYMFIRIFSLDRPYWIIRSVSVESYESRRSGLFYDTLKKLSLRYSDRTVAGSGSGARDIKNLLSPHKVRVSVIADPCPGPCPGEGVSEFRHPFFRSGRTWPVFVSSGVLCREKAFDVLLKAFALYLRKNDARLVIAGEGEEERSLKDLAASLNIRDRVWFRPVREDIGSLLSSCDIYIDPAREAAQVYDILEAVSCSLPVIASDCSAGAGELITNGLNGVLFMPDNPVDLYYSMEKLVSDGELRKEILKNSRSLLEDHSQEKLRGEWAALLERAFLIAEKRKRYIFSFGYHGEPRTAGACFEEKDAEALCRIKEDTGLSGLAGAVFVDVLCGDGKISHAAFRLGAEKVISFDKEPDFIEETEKLRSGISYPDLAEREWRIDLASILDMEYCSPLFSSGDIVYATGGLHYSGDMYQAVRNSAAIVKPGGWLILSAGNHASSSVLWAYLKKVYSDMWFLRPFMLLSWAVVRWPVYIGRNGFSAMGVHGRRALLRDAAKWLGSYPYEFACSDDMIEFIEGLGLKHVRTIVQLPCGKAKVPRFAEIMGANTGANEFVFRKPEAE